ncbi:MAG: type I DNA topoisomerase [Pirellulales bacterium]
MSSGKKKSLVIVESPAKAKTISKYLGPDFQVEASIGHIRDLPQGSKEVPEKYKSQSWSYLGVNIDEDFSPIYIIPPDKKKHVSKLQAAVKEAKDLYLATDEDREGEAISWHLHEVLKPKVPVHRLVFHEITKEAILNALESPRQIDEGLVRAQETRRILDRLYGYDVSQLLWKKVRPRLSAGRVQSVAVRLIVERERERMAFRSATYFDLEGIFLKSNGASLHAAMVSYEGKKLPSGKDFDPATGKIKDPNLLLLNGAQAEALRDQLSKASYRVTNVEVKPFVERPKPPFTTSTLQQEANRKLGLTARRTMQIAQSLYENGYITYMRTDSTNLAQVAIDAARDLVQSQYGSHFLHPTARNYSTKVKNAQEAHEAIRPAGHPFQLPDALRNELDRDQFRLFEMIWKRTIASQMADARKQRMTVTIEGGGAVFQASGTSIEFEGFLRAYVEGSDDPSAELAEQETILPELAPQESLNCKELKSLSHTTQPPARFTEASLTRTLEERGIGRPSTYASIIDTILERSYVFKKGNALVPSWTAFAVIRLLEDHLGSLVDYEFTAQMEDYLDAISRNEGEHIHYLKNFYLGSDSGESRGLKPLLDTKTTEIDPRTACQYAIGVSTDPNFPGEIHVRVGKFGPFLEHGERRASIPDSMAPDELTIDKALELLSKQAAGDEPLGADPTTGKPIFVKQGRFGPYVQLGANDDEEKKLASLLKGMDPASIDIDTALQLLSLPRELGVHPESSEPIIATNGRYGPYVKCGSESRSLPENLGLLTITLDEALQLLAQPKTGRGRAAATPKAPLQTFAESPVTGKPIQLLDGRYGPYVTDGETNASIPKGTEAAGVTFELAIQWLAERAAAGGSKKKKGAKKASTKKAAKKADGDAAPKATKKAAKKATKKASKAAKKKS